MDIKKAMDNQEFTKPEPATSDRTIPKSEWTVPLPNNKGMQKNLLFTLLFLNMSLYF